jgi:tRNA1Val (adenine37-N6)-methyltransferase
MPNLGFRFQQFFVKHENCAHKVGTDGVILAAWANLEGARQILDIGSGSGLIALICAQRLPEGLIIGIEQDLPAYQESLENVAKSPFGNRIEVQHADFTKINLSKQFDAIISNPPFFKGTTSSGKLSRDQARATEALPHSILAQKSAKLLSEKGTLHLILPKTEAQDFIELAQKNHLYLKRRCKVYGKPKADDKRWMLSFSSVQSDKTQEESLYLRDENLNYSAHYKALTKNLYL